MFENQKKGLLFIKCIGYSDKILYILFDIVNSKICHSPSVETE